MLGVRRFKGTQIDLWQGNITKFASDLSEPSPARGPSNDASLDGLRRAWDSLFQKAWNQGGRHLTVNIDAIAHVIPAIDAVKHFIESRGTHPTAKPIQRITLVATSMDVYDALQERLFASFEDLDHD